MIWRFPFVPLFRRLVSAPADAIEITSDPAPPVAATFVLVDISLVPVLNVSVVVAEAAFVDAPN